jgi:hypothetical protein
MICSSRSWARKQSLLRWRTSGMWSSLHKMSWIKPNTWAWTSNIGDYYLHRNSSFVQTPFSQQLVRVQTYTRVVPRFPFSGQNNANVSLKKCRFGQSVLCTAKTQYREFETNIPRKGITRPQSPFSTFMCLWATYIFPRSVCLIFCCTKTMWTDRRNI